jgi:hypothetical protein
MPLHLLGFSRSAGVCRASGVDWVVRGELAAAVVPLPPSPTPLEHAAHLAAIYRHGDVLPMRFGAALPDVSAVGNFIDREREKLLEQLDRLQGTAEIGVRIAISPAPGPPASPEPGEEERKGGQSPFVRSSLGAVRTNGDRSPSSAPAHYLARRRAQYQSQDQLALRVQLSAEHCTGMLKGHCRDWRRLSPEPPGAVRLAFLVERNLSQSFAERLATLSVARLGERYAILGPWPPYSFV